VRDEQKQAWARLRAWLEDKQYVLDQVFGTCCHNHGIPDVLYWGVQPQYSPVQGACVLLVTLTRVDRYVCKTHSKVWERECTRAYDTTARLEDILEELTEQPVGCW
jgi:hypothetical protein